MAQTDVRRVPLDDDWGIRDKPAGMGEMYYRQCPDCEHKWKADEDENECYKCGHSPVLSLL
jgi:ssDNA-binding Zn-finger/Zn-ribbon topoisomerase 1